jgi:hypothetical protein
VNERREGSLALLTDDLGDGDDGVVVSVCFTTSTESGVVVGHLARALSGEVLSPAYERLAHETVG